jgi:hypothetical protein
VQCGLDYAEPFVGRQLAEFFKDVGSGYASSIA